MRVTLQQMANVWRMEQKANDILYDEQMYINLTGGELVFFIVFPDLDTVFLQITARKWQK